jgi:DNA polymerase-3 subunit beta
VLAELGVDGLRLVATDGRRLAVAEVPLGDDAARPAPSRHLLPASALALLGRLAAGPGEAVLAMFGERQALFQTAAAALRVRYVEGHFPPWQKVIPVAPRALVPVAAGRLLSAVRQAAAVREPQGGRLTVRFGPGRVLVESRRPGQGRARVRQYQPLSAAVVEVPLRASDVIELLTAVGPEAGLLLGVTGPEAPVLAVTADGYRHVLMPLGRA